MKTKHYYVIAHIFAVIGILFFVATGFELLNAGTADFLGIASFIIAGAIYAIGGMLSKRDKNK